MSVLVHAGADVVRRQVGRWGSVEDVDGQRCRLQMDVDDLAWPMFALAGLGVGFEVEGPPELTERTAAVGALFTQAAQASRPRSGT